MLIYKIYNTVVAKKPWKMKTILIFTNLNFLFYGYKGNRFTGILKFNLFSDMGLVAHNANCFVSCSLDYLKSCRVMGDHCIICFLD